MSKASQANLFSELRTVAQLASRATSRTVSRRTGLLGSLSLSSLIAACGGGGGGGGGAASTTSKTYGYTLNGINAGDRSGQSVSAAGDVNKDGVDDLLIGAPEADPNGNSNAGQTYLVFGDELANLDGNSNGIIDLTATALNGTTGYILNGIAGADWSGYSVSSAGDVNKDGYDDLLIGASSADLNGNSNAGQTYLVLGGTSNLQSFDAQDGSTDGMLDLNLIA